MKVRLTEKQDVYFINHWLKLHEQPPVTNLPVHSYIVPGVATMSVRHCEGGIGFIEAQATNPAVSGATRNKALNALYDKILSLEVFNGYIGFTSASDALERAIQRGFALNNQRILVYSKGI